MKFLSNFDTDIDTVLLKQALLEYSKDDVLLIKKHPIFLMKSLLRYCIVILSTVSFIYLLLSTPYANEMIIYFFVIILIVLFIFWFLSIFNRYYKYSFFFHSTINASDSLQSQWTKKLDMFIRHSLILMWGYAIIFLLFIWKQVLVDTGTLLRITIISCLCILAIVVSIYQLIFIHIRYELNFLLITPDYVEHIDQKSFFSRKYRTVKAKQIRTIEVSQDWIIQWLFHLWKATFVTDALHGQKDIYLTFDLISNASHIKQKILWLLKN